MTTLGVQPDDAKIQKLEAELDPEMRFRPLLPVAAWIVAAALFGLSCFHYYTAGFGLLPETLHRGIHISCVLGLIFLVFSWNKSGNIVPPKASLFAPLGIGIVDWLCCIAAVVTSLYVPYVFHDLQFRVGNPDPIDWIMGTVMIVVLLEATRRSVGWPLPIIAVVLMAYALWGRNLPGILAHPGNTWKSVVNHLYLTSQGIYGIALGVVATYVFHYVLFGVLATRVGLGRFFIDLATALTGRFSGGPAKVSIFGSAMFGMISGSSIANTVTVGSLTIPAMIRIGYARHFAGAVEAAAATGGQITPPIMGAAAFLMVEYLAVPYQTIIVAAIVPAFMHFFGVFCQIHFEAKKHGLQGLPKSELPVAREVIRRDWPTAMPLAVLLMVLFSDFTPYLAAYWGITGCIVLGLTNRNRYVAVAFVAAVALCIRLQILTEWSGLLSIIGASIAASAWFVLLRDEGGRARLLDILDAFVVGAKYAISVGAAAACVGIIIGIVTLTGVGFKLSTIITGAAGGYFRVSRHLRAREPVRRQSHDLVLHAGDDRDRLHPARLRHTDHGELSHHGDDRGARARDARRAAARLALLRFLLRRARRHHAAGRARGLRGRQHGGRRSRSRPATRHSGSGSPRRWCRSCSSIRPRCCW